MSDDPKLLPAGEIDWDAIDKCLKEAFKEFNLARLITPDRITREIQKSPGFDRVLLYKTSPPCDLGPIRDPRTRGFTPQTIGDGTYQALPAADNK